MLVQKSSASGAGQPKCTERAARAGFVSAPPVSKVVKSASSKITRIIAAILISGAIKRKQSSWHVKKIAVALIELRCALRQADADQEGYGRTIEQGRVEH
jgi:hypothetical protein